MKKNKGMMELTVEESRAIGELMNLLSDAMSEICDAKAVGLVLVSGEGNTAIMFHPRVLKDPIVCSALLTGIRGACDINEEQFLKPKLQ